MNYLHLFAFQDSVAGRVSPICLVVEAPHKLLMNTCKAMVIRDTPSLPRHHGLTLSPRGIAHIQKVQPAQQRHHPPSRCSRRSVRPPISYVIDQTSLQQINTVGPTFPWPSRHHICVDFEAIAHQHRVTRLSACVTIVPVRIPRLLRRSLSKNHCRVHGQISLRYARATMVDKAIAVCDMLHTCSCSLYISSFLTILCNPFFQAWTGEADTRRSLWDLYCTVRTL